MDDNDGGSSANGCFFMLVLGGMMWVALWEGGGWLWTTFAGTH